MSRAAIRLQTLRIVVSILTVSSALFASRGVLRAQEYKYEVGGAAGWTYYAGDASRKGPWAAPGLEIGALARYNINFRWAVSATLAYRSISIDTRFADNAFPEEKTAKLYSSLYWLGASGEFNFFPYSNKYAYLNTSRISPYIGLGIGIGAFPSNKGMSVAPGASMTIGTKYKLSDQWDISLAWSGIRLLTDRLDAPTESAAWLENPYRIDQSVFRSGDGVGGLTLSITYSFGIRQGDCNKKVKQPKFQPLKFK